MSAAKLLAQSNPALLIGFSGWKQPVLYHVRFTVSGGAGAPTLVTATASNGATESSLDATVTRVAAAVYDITFPPCRRIALGTLTGSTGSASAGSFAAFDVRSIGYDRSSTNTNATTGKLRIAFAAGSNVSTELAAGMEANISFWADLG